MIDFAGIKNYFVTVVITHGIIYYVRGMKFPVRLARLNRTLEGSCVHEVYPACALPATKSRVATYSVFT